MSHQELTDALKVVHQQLTEADHLDQDDVEKLRQTMNEIQTALQQQSSEESFGERISDSAKRFEESHPVLTKTLVDLVSRLRL